MSKKTDKITARLLRKMEKRFDDVFPTRPKTMHVRNPFRRRRRPAPPKRELRIFAAESVGELESRVNEYLSGSRRGDIYPQPLKYIKGIGYTIVVDATLYPEEEQEGTE